MKPENVMKFVTLLVLSQAILACNAEAGRAFTPLVADAAPVREMFLRADAIGGTPVIARVDSIRHVDDFRIRWSGDTAVFPNSIEARLTVLAGENRGESMLYRGALSDGLCGYRESDPTTTVCAQVSFAPDGIASGDMWAFVTAAQGDPESGSVATIAGRRLPPGTDAAAAFADMTAFLER